MLSHYRRRARGGRQIPFQRCKPPTHGAARLEYYGIHLSRNAAEDQRRAYDVTRDQFTQDTSISRDLYFPTDNYRDGLGKFTTLYKSLSNLKRGPGSNAQNLEDFPRR